jgi:hypothetical protein
MNNRLSKFERDVIDKLLNGNSNALRILKSQIDMAQIARRYTGAGFFLSFDVPDTCSRVMPEKCRIGDVTATIAGLKYGAGFVLYVNDGLVRQLEGYCYEETWPDEIREYTLSYMDQCRNLPFQFDDERTNKRRTHH